MWRVQYFQSVCCVCNIYPAVPQPAVSQKESLPLKLSFFSSLICQACHDSIAWCPEPLQQQIAIINHNNQLARSLNLEIQSAAPHLNFIRSAIIAFKYKEQLDALPVVVHAIQQLPRPHGCHSGNSLSVPTPTTSNRLQKRGYDPVSVLAYYLSKHWQIPLWRGLSRIDDVSSQQGLDRQERQANIGTAFKLNTQPDVNRLLLFDDVVTTGTTLSAIAQTLAEAYPETKISAYCVSHGK